MQNSELPPQGTFVQALDVEWELDIPIELAGKD